jgi:hypothetical protein
MKWFEIIHLWVGMALGVALSLVKDYNLISCMILGGVLGFLFYKLNKKERLAIGGRRGRK